jgi:hypothetical protein
MANHIKPLRGFVLQYQVLNLRRYLIFKCRGYRAPISLEFRRALRTKTLNLRKFFHQKTLTIIAELKLRRSEIIKET